MREYVTEAVVLHKEPVRDLDARYSFFTKRFGKVIGKATSTRKITSRLAGHLEPGTVAQVRFVEKSGTQIVDALKKRRAKAAVSDLKILNRLLADGEPDMALWEAVSEDRFFWPDILRILGWDPRYAVCERCGKMAAAFSANRQQFFCAACISHTSSFRSDELLLLGNAEV